MEASTALSIVLRELEGPALREVKQRLADAREIIKRQEEDKELREAYVEQLAEDLVKTRESWMWERDLARGAYDDQHKDFTLKLRTSNQEIRSLKQELKQTNAQLARRVATLDKLRKHPSTPDADAAQAQDS